MKGKKRGKTSNARVKRTRPDREAALERELKREKGEGRAVVGDMGKNRNLSGSSTWETLKPPKATGPKSTTKAASSGGPPSSDAGRDIARVRQQLADRLRHRGVRLTGQETPPELADLMDAVERFERTVEASGGDLMVDEPATPGAAVPKDQRAFVLPQRRDNEPVAKLIARITETATAAAKHRTP